jgi:hypothetical protein
VPATKQVAPNDLLIQTNLSGTISDIQDDPNNPDANWLTAIADDENTICLVGFYMPSDTDSRPIQSGDQLQEFYVQARKTSTATGNRHPTLTVSLYENGTFLDGIGTFTVESTGSQVFSSLWDASKLSDISGFYVQCNAVGTVSSGNPSQQRTVEIGAIEWRAATGRRRGYIAS